MPGFEHLRQRIFEHRAEEYQAGMDPATGLLPSARVAFGAHSRAAGHSIRGAAEGAVCLAMTGRTELAWRLLGVVLDHQDTDESPPPPLRRLPQAPVRAISCPPFRTGLRGAAG